MELGWENGFIEDNFGLSLLFVIIFWWQVLWILGLLVGLLVIGDKVGYEVVY